MKEMRMRSTCVQALVGCWMHKLHEGAGPCRRGRIVPARREREAGSPLAEPAPPPTRKSHQQQQALKDTSSRARARSASSSAFQRPLTCRLKGGQAGNTLEGATQAFKCPSSHVPALFVILRPILNNWFHIAAAHVERKEGDLEMSPSCDHNGSFSAGTTSRSLYNSPTSTSTLIGLERVQTDTTNVRIAQTSIHVEIWP